MTEQPNDAHWSLTETKAEQAHEAGRIAAENVINTIRLYLCDVTDAIDAIPSYAALSPEEEGMIEVIETAMIEWGLQTRRVKDANDAAMRALLAGMTR